MKFKTKKRLVGIITATALIAGATGITASAITNDVFSFNLGRGERDWTSAVKDNHNDYATVNVTSGTLSTTVPIFFSIYNSDNAIMIAPSVEAREDGTYTLDYDLIPPVGDKAYLHANAGYDGAQAAGTWTP